jgi:hypothetical protein
VFLGFVGPIGRFYSLSLYNTEPLFSVSLTTSEGTPLHPGEKFVNIVINTVQQIENLQKCWLPVHLDTMQTSVCRDLSRTLQWIYPIIWIMDMDISMDIRNYGYNYGYFG